MNTPNTTTTGAAKATSARFENYDLYTMVDTSAIEYIYLSSDAARSDAGHLLLQSAILQTGIFTGGEHARSLIMTARGFQTLLDSCPHAASMASMPMNAALQWQPHPAAHLDLSESERAGWLIHQFLHTEQQGEGVRSFGRLHVLTGGDAKWQGRSYGFDIKEEGRLVEETENAEWSELPEAEQLRLLVLKRCGLWEHSAVISRESAFLQELAEECLNLYGEDSTQGNGLMFTPLLLGDDGLLSDPAEQLRRADADLSVLVKNTRLYIDESALRHARAKDFLAHAEPHLRMQEKQLHLLISKNEPLAPNMVSWLLARAQGSQPLVRFARLDEALPKGQAQAQKLKAEHAEAAEESFTLITDRLSRAAKVQNQLADEGMALALCTVNRHGYLSRRSAPAPQQRKLNKLAPEELERKMLAALGRQDAAELRLMAERGQAVEAGIKAAVCGNDADMLRELLTAAPAIPASTLRWWMLENESFNDPFYLSRYPHFYRMLAQALPKAEFKVALAAKLLHRLMSLSGQKGSSQAELAFLAQLFHDAMEAQGEDAATIRIARGQIPQELPHTGNEFLIKLEESHKRSLFKRERLHANEQTLERQLEATRKELKQLERFLPVLEERLSLKWQELGRA